MLTNLALDENMPQLIDSPQNPVFFDGCILKKIFLVTLTISFFLVNAFANDMRVVRNFHQRQYVTTILDIHTNLEWQHDGKNVGNWQGAVEYCRKLNINKKMDWRLPSVKELFSIAAYSNRVIDQSRKTVVNAYFRSSTIDSEYWSSTGFRGTRDHAWFLNFKSGIVHFEKKDMTFYIRCVRDQ